MIKQTALTLFAGLAVLSSPAMARITRTVAVIAPSGECKFHNGLCAAPHRLKVAQNSYSGVSVGVPTSHTLDTVTESDNCRGLVSFTLRILEGSFAQYRITSPPSGTTGVCHAKFKGTSEGHKVGPAKLTVTVIPA